MSAFRPLAALLALTLSATVAAAQDAPAGATPARFTVEGFLQHNAFGEKVVPGTKDNYGGYGARLMFNRSDASKALRSFVDRGSIGVYASYAARQGGSRDASVLQAGLQGDVALFPAPIRGILDPFVSVGAGVIRTSARTPDATKSSFALTPAVGTRIPLFSGIGFRGDLRLPLTLGDASGTSLSAEGGVYISF